MNDTQLFLMKKFGRNPQTRRTQTKYERHLQNVHFGLPSNEMFCLAFFLTFPCLGVRTQAAHTSSRIVGMKLRAHINLDWQFERERSCWEIPAYSSLQVTLSIFLWMKGLRISSEHRVMQCNRTNVNVIGSDLAVTHQERSIFDGCLRTVLTSTYLQRIQIAYCEGTSLIDGADALRSTFLKSIFT